MKLEDFSWPDSVRERFNQQVEKAGTCHLWRGTCDDYGYGYLYVSLGPAGPKIKTGPKGPRSEQGTHQKTRRVFRIKAHRLAIILRDGEIPDDLDSCHTCDTPACVRDDHLFVGTQAQNVRDMDSKRRRRVGVGERHGFARLKDAQVYAIRRRLDAHENYLLLAKEFDVCGQTIYDIGNRKTWGHLPD